MMKRMEITVGVTVLCVAAAVGYRRAWSEADSATVAGTATSAGAESGDRGGRLVSLSTDYGALRSMAGGVRAGGARGATGVTEHVRYPEDELALPVRGPLVPVDRVYPLCAAAEGPVGEGFPGEEAWANAFAGEDFFGKGQLEEEAWATTFRMLRSGNELLVLAECRRPADGGDGADSLELYLTQSREPTYPYVTLRVGSDGSSQTGIVARPYTWWVYAPTDPVPPGSTTSEVTPGTGVWRAKLRLSLSALGVPAEEFRFNVVRRRGGGSVFSWCDLWGGPPNQVELFARAVTVADPGPWKNGLELPAALAVGANRLAPASRAPEHPARASGPAPGLRARVGKETRKLDETGEIALTVSDRGPVDLELLTADGTVIAKYHADVPRPFLVSASAPFLEEGAQTFALDVALNVAATEPVPVTVRATREGGEAETLALELEPGRHAVTCPVPAGTGREVAVEAEARVPVESGAGALPPLRGGGGKDTLKLSARHWFAVGVKAEELDAYREGIRELPTDRMYWAVIADSMALRRLEQAGSGAYGRVTRDQSSMWQQAYVYCMALLYSKEHRGNPYRGDKRLLQSAVLGMEFALRPTISAEEHTNPDNRSLQAYLLTYELLKDAIEPARREYWAYELKHRVRGTVLRWLQPLAGKQAMYNADCGTSTNHTSYYVANVALAGEIFDVPEWKDLARESMRKLARHGSEGNFEERQGVPASHYTWLSANGLAEYYQRTHDADVARTLAAVARYETAITTADGLTMCLFDGRSSSYQPFWDGDHVLSQTPAGRAAARARLLGVMRNRPSAMRLEPLWRCAENGLYFTPGEEADFTADGEYAFSHGVIVRRQGFQYGLSTVCLPPITGPFVLDPQNVVELFHRDAGCILNAANSCHQPEAGTFFRRTSQAELDRSPTAPRTDYMPVTASIAHLPDGYDLTLSYWSFDARLAVHVLSPTEVRVVVTPQFDRGEEPVVFSFFPGLRRGEETQVDGTTLRFRNVVLTGTREFQVGSGFRLWDPYGQTFGTTNKPVRCWVELRSGESFVLEVHLQAP